MKEKAQRPEIPAVTGHIVRDRITKFVYMHLDGEWRCISNAYVRPMAGSLPGERFRFLTTYRVYGSPLETTA